MRDHNNKPLFLILMLFAIALPGCMTTVEQWVGNGEVYKFTVLKTECGSTGKGGCSFGQGTLCEGDVYVYLDITNSEIATLSMNRNVCVSSYVLGGTWYTSSQLQGNYPGP